MIPSSPRRDQVILCFASALGMYGGERVLADLRRELRRRPGTSKTLIIDADDDARETVGQQFMQAYFYVGSSASVVLAIVGFAAAAVAKELPATGHTNLRRTLYAGTATSTVTVAVVLAGGYFATLIVTFYEMVQASRPKVFTSSSCKVVGSMLTHVT